MKTALFPGTFDPPTLGHVDIIRRSQTICDKLYVGIAINSTKPDDLFTIEERIAMLKEICKPYPHADVVTFSTLVVEFAKQNKVDYLIRGLRAFSDFEYEARMALANRKLSGIETVFLMADERVGHISSTLIRELGRFKCRLNDFVPSEIEDQIFKKVSKGSS
ncbi:MAG: pantetheine-phosphate adenylyltransferase [Verrucomicrobia bacterium]|nr:pantetheine-phosphate adenylyltransferase [Verrucomicrobiota bacterium]